MNRRHRKTPEALSRESVPKTPEGARIEGRVNHSVSGPYSVPVVVPTSRVVIPGVSGGGILWDALFLLFRSFLWAIVALLILRTGIYILRESAVELMDAVPSKELAEQIAELLRDVPGVEQLHEVQAHRFGPHSVVNVTIGVNGDMAVKDGDKISSKVEALLCDAIPNLRRVHLLADSPRPPRECHQKPNRRCRKW